MNKDDPRKNILDLLEAEGVCPTQESIRIDLEKKGVSISQSTVSRHLKELKNEDEVVQDSDGYKLQKDDTVKKRRKKLEDLLVENMIDVPLLELNSFLIRCKRGYANAISEEIKGAYPEDVLATIPADDSVLVIVKNQSVKNELAKKLTP